MSISQIHEAPRLAAKNSQSLGASALHFSDDVAPVCFSPDAAGKSVVLLIALGKSVQKKSVEVFLVVRVKYREWTPLILVSADMKESRDDSLNSGIRTQPLIPGIKIGRKAKPVPIAVHDRPRGCTDPRRRWWLIGIIPCDHRSRELSEPRAGCFSQQATQPKCPSKPLVVLPAHFLEETRPFEFVDEMRLDEAFRIGVRQIRPRPR